MQRNPIRSTLWLVATMLVLTLSVLTATGPARAQTSHLRNRADTTPITVQASMTIKAKPGQVTSQDICGVTTFSLRPGYGQFTYTVSVESFQGNWPVAGYNGSWIIYSPPQNPIPGGPVSGSGLFPGTIYSKTETVITNGHGQTQFVVIGQGTTFNGNKCSTLAPAVLYFYTN